MKFTSRLTAFLAMLMLLLSSACAPTPTREGTGEYIDDTIITSKVKAAFAADPDVKATEVKVETFKGEVQLSGFVNSAESARKAVQIAQGVKGVKLVRNNTVLK